MNKPSDQAPTALQDFSGHTGTRSRFYCGLPPIESANCYAVLGYPAAHSLSPQIHTHFSRQYDQSLDYFACEILPVDFVNSVYRFFACGGAGLNITIPFKTAAWELAQDHDPAAARSKAVNTLYRVNYQSHSSDQRCRLHGANTDGIGLVHDLQHNLGFSLAHKRVLILGAGGAARGILPALLEAGVQTLQVVNRSVARAQQFAADFPGVSVVLWQASSAWLRPCDLIINATPAALQGQEMVLPEDIFTPQSWCYDLAYGARRTPFLRQASRCGVSQLHDGLGMLVEQAAAAFYLWHGLKPHTMPVITDLRKLIGTSN